MHISMDKGFDTSGGPLIGICLLGDGLPRLCDPHHPSASCSSESNDNGTMIGVIKCDDLNQHVNNFRLHLQTQLPMVPPKFKFLCKNGWPIEKNQESSLTIQTLVNSSIVKIQRNFDIPRFGVRWYQGDFLGFIFVDFNCNLSEVRDAIVYQLKGKFSAECPFEFRDKNGWPVVKNQEKELIIWDVCHNNYFNICKSESKLNMSLKDSSSTTKRPSKKCKLSKDSEEKNGFALPEDKIKDSKKSASILISYVHGEASKHARDLKSELVNLGCKVFLDIDDIPSGCDWQDVINREVSSCVAFVALVTPSYGETRWTNREAKFADDKEKHIIPISFLDKWPPDQLAIQFLSLQYIRWKTYEEIKLAEDLGEGHRAKDIRYWDKGCVHRVAKEILKWLPQSSGVSTPDGPSSSSHIAFRGPPDSLSLDVLTPSQPDGYFLGLQNYNEEEADIVISAHPKQKDFVENMKKVLEEADFKVWSSLDMIDSASSSQEDAYSNDSQHSVSVADHVSNSPLTPNHHSEHSQDSVTTAKRPKFLFSYSAENGVHCSGYNFNSQEVCTPETPTTVAKLKQFKCKTEKAKLVILVVSEDYCASCMCKKQAYYCEHRKKVIAIKFGDFDLRCPLFFGLYQEQDMLQGTNDEKFLVKLREQVKETVCRTFVCLRKFEEKVQKMVTYVKKRIMCERSIYVIGGTRFISGRNEEICISLGTELAKLKWLSLVTEGFFGVSEVLGRNFCEERVITNKGKPTNLRNKVYHIVPQMDKKDFSKKARQEEGGAFEKIPFGETIYCGNSIAERDAVASSLFKICILIEGGYRTARLAEKFMWNDCIIIPVKSTGGAAAGKYSLPSRMLQVPCGVSESDWEKLENPQETVEEISYAVKKIIKTLFKIRDIKL